MGIVWDTAEFLNLIYGAALGESATSIREKLSRWQTRERLATALKRVALEFPGLPDAVREDLAVLATDSNFLVRVSGGYVPQEAIDQLDRRLLEHTANLDEATSTSLGRALSAAAEQAIGSAMTVGERMILSQMKASRPLLDAAQASTFPTSRRLVPDSLVPKDLRDRESELKWLTSALDEGRSGVWYLGPSFSGKTAFLAWCAKNLIPAQYLATCFIRSTGQRNSSLYCLRTLHRQLTVIVGRNSEPPFLLGELMDELAHLIDEAAERASRDSSRVVVLLDGLDEAEDREGLSEVLAWLCERPREHVTIILSSRTGVNVDLDTFDWLVRSQIAISPCPAAMAARTAVVTELRLAEESGNGLGRWVLAALAVHTFGLAILDIQRLLAPTTSEDPGALQIVMRSSLGRSVECVVSNGQEVFRIAHDEVLAEARSKLTRETDAVIRSTLSYLSSLESAGWPEVAPRFLLYPIVTTLCDAAVTTADREVNSLAVFDSLIALLHNDIWMKRVRDDLDWSVNPDGVVAQVQKSIMIAFDRGLIDRKDQLTLLARCGIVQVGGSRRQAGFLAAVCTAQAYCGQPHQAVQRSWGIYDPNVRLSVVSEVAEASARDGDIGTALQIAESLDASAARASLLGRILRTSIGRDGVDLETLANQCLDGLDDITPGTFRDEVSARIVYALYVLGYRAQSLERLDTIVSLEARAYALRDLMNLGLEFDAQFSGRVARFGAQIARDAPLGRPQDLLAGGLLIPVLNRVSSSKATDLLSALMQAIANIARSSHQGPLLAAVSNGLGRCSRLREAFDVALTIKARVPRALAVSRLTQRLTGADIELGREMLLSIESVTAEASGEDVARIWGRVAFGLWYSGDSEHAELVFSRALEGARMARSAERARAYSELTRLCRFSNQLEKARHCLSLCEESADLQPHMEESLRAEALVLATKPEVRLIWPRSVRELAVVADQIAQRSPHRVGLQVVGAAACMMRDMETAKFVLARLDGLATRVHLGMQMLRFGADLLDGDDTVAVLREASELSAQVLRDDRAQWQLGVLALECYTELGFTWPAQSLLDRLLSEFDCLGALGRVEAAFLERVLTSDVVPKEQQHRFAISARRLVLGHEEVVRERPSLVLALARLDEGWFEAYRGHGVNSMASMNGLSKALTAAAWIELSRAKGLTPSPALWKAAEGSVVLLRGRTKAQASLELAKLAHLGGDELAAAFWSAAALEGATESRDAHARALWCAKILSRGGTPPDVSEGALIGLLLSGYMRLHIDAVPEWLLTELVQRRELILVGYNNRVPDGREM